MKIHEEMSTTMKRTRRKRVEKYDDDDVVFTEEIPISKNILFPCNVIDIPFNEMMTTAKTENRFWWREKRAKKKKAEISRWEHSADEEELTGSKKEEE